MDSQAKALAHVGAEGRPSQWETDGILVTILDVAYDEDRNALRVSLVASRSAELLPLDTPYLYVNPPLGDDVARTFVEMVSNTVRQQAG